MTNIILYIQTLSFNLVNFIFGKTAIFVVILGWYLIITGIIFLIKPDNARVKLVRSGFGIVKLNILLGCFFLWGLLAKWSQAFSGAVQTIVFFAGLLGLILLFLRSQSVAQKKLVTIANQIPVKVLTWFAWGQVAVGILMVYLQRRLW